LGCSAASAEPLRFFACFMILYLPR
jgi:hypothetical protein